jgi:hypothetical protein
MDEAGRKIFGDTIRKEIIKLIAKHEIPVRESFEQEYPSGRFRTSWGCTRLPSDRELAYYRVFYSTIHNAFLLELREVPSTEMKFHVLPLSEFEELVSLGQVAIVG